MSVEYVGEPTCGVLIFTLTSGAGNVLPLTCVYGKIFGIEQIDEARLTVRADLSDLALHDLAGAPKKREGAAHREPEHVYAASRVEIAPDRVVVDPEPRFHEITGVMHYRRGEKRRLRSKQLWR